MQRNVADQDHKAKGDEFFRQDEAKLVLASRLDALCPPGARVVAIGPGIEFPTVIHYSHREGWPVHSPELPDDWRARLNSFRDSGAAIVAVYFDPKATAAQRASYAPLLRALPDGCLDRLFLMFPDPWPKSRHAKRRFVHPAQIPDVARVLRTGGEWRIASDDPAYQAWVTDVLAEQSLFRVPPPAAARPEGWPPTRYEAKALAAGRTPLYWRLERLTTPLPEPPPKP